MGIEKNNQLKISVIGVGNAGSQAAVAAANYGFKTFIINSSTKDLQEAVVKNNMNAFLIGNGRGCAKDRKISKGFYNQSKEALFDDANFIDTIDDADIVVCVTAAPGGTGSGCTPTLAYNIKQQYKEKNVMIVAYMPKISECGAAQYNMYEFINEVDNLQIPYNLIDASVMEADDNTTVHEALAKAFVERLKVIRGDYFHPSTDDMIDESDTMSIFTTPGYWTISILNGITQDQIDEGKVQDLMLEKLKTDLNATIQRDKIIKRIGVVFNSNGDISDSVKTGDYAIIKNSVGEAPYVFTHHGIIDQAESQMILILSGLSMPYDRLLKCKAKIEAIQQAEAAGKAKKSISDDLGNMGFMKSDDSQRASILGVSLDDKVEDLNNIPDFLL